MGFVQVPQARDGNAPSSLINKPEKTPKFKVPLIFFFTVGLGPNPQFYRLPIFLAIRYITIRVYHNTSQQLSVIHLKVHAAEVYFYSQNDKIE